jgi:protein gp37
MVSRGEMNKTKIEWTDFTANPVDGSCLHKCWYCYEAQRRKRFHLRDEITFNPNWFDQSQADNFSKKYGRPAKIFVGSTHDLWGSWIPDDWRLQILSICIGHPKHTFQFLTKNPYSYSQYAYSENCQLGLTIDKNEVLAISLGKITAQARIELLKKVTADFKFISFEPLLSDMSGLDLKGINLAIIGAMTHQGKKNVIPKLQWIESIEKICKRDGVEIFYKENVKPYLKK